MKILVTGGLGYIGSHVVVLLLEQGHEVVIIDTLENASLAVLEGIEKITHKKPVFEKVDVRNLEALENLFLRHSNISGAIHFAAYKSVSESVSKPLEYYQNNVGGLLCLLQILVPQKIPLIFSSSCTVYGQADKVPISEEAPFKEATSPYGSTKQMGEQIISNTAKVHPDFKTAVLRYFNPIGAHPSSLIGELPKGTPQNLVPFLTQAVAGKRNSLTVFGNDYDTPDGTCIRDYIHVMDLAAAHIESLQYTMSTDEKPNFEVFNVGSGKGYSVLEVIECFEQATGKKVPYEIGTRRPGDVVSAFANTKKVERVLGWKVQHSLEEALLSAWKWEAALAAKSS